MESQYIRTLQKKRTSNFREDETKLLIQLWGSPFIQNKLYLTHRKAPVMRILAANMQQRGFYRTPDEIKTRIRNLKCLYHRIKRTTTSGAGVGIVDPDWPHFKAMDAILSKEGQKRNRIDENILEGPRCEDIKQEVDIDINDDMESWATNDSLESEASEETSPQLPVLRPAPTTKPSTETTTQHKPMTTMIPSFTIPTQNAVSTSGVKSGSVPSIPLPLLIFNSLQPQLGQEKKGSTMGNIISSSDKIQTDLSNVLKELLEVQKENLNIEKQKLEIAKQKLEFDRLVGSQLLTIVPMVGGILQRLALATAEENACKSEEILKGQKRKGSEEIDILKDSKILRTVLEQGIRKYMMGDLEEEKDTDNEENENQNEENSNSSSK